jgi:hypothetical protein
VQLSFEYAPDLAFFLAVTPWPYADWYREVADRVEVTDYSRYNLINPIIKPDALSRDELSALLSKAFLRFYRDKMYHLDKLSEEKRTYMMRVAKLLMEESYLSAEARETMAGLGHPGPMGHPGTLSPGGHPASIAIAGGHPAGIPIPAGHPGMPGTGAPGVPPDERYAA